MVFSCFLLQYGFTKVRRGPDMDMYAHPSFVRGHPEMLGLLRKCTSSSGRKSSGAPSGNRANIHSRAVSPSPPGSPSRQKVVSFVQSHVDKSSNLGGSKFFLSDSSLLSRSSTSAFDPGSKLSGAGRLDLLTMALTTLAERDSA